MIQVDFFDCDAFSKMCRIIGATPRTTKEFERERDLELARFNATFDFTKRTISFKSEADYTWFILTYS